MIDLNSNLLDIIYEPLSAILANIEVLEDAEARLRQHQSCVCLGIRFIVVRCCVAAGFAGVLHC